MFNLFRPFCPLVFLFIPPLALSVPVDIDGDGLVGPREVIDLSQHWKGPAQSPGGGGQPWQVLGPDLMYSKGKVGVGASTPRHQLRISGGPPWTSNGWGGAIELDNAAAIAWNGNNAGMRFGIGQTNGGLLFFRSASDPGTVESPALYDMVITDQGDVGIGDVNPSAKLRVAIPGEIGTAISATGGGAGVIGSGSIGVLGVATNLNIAAIRGDGPLNIGGGLAGQFFGNVSISGVLSKNGGQFKIDHPLDPENKYLCHSFVESPDMMNIYNGNVITDASGYATVTLPDWFGVLNKDFRYQLTVLDEEDTEQFVQAKVVKKIADNRFTLRSSRPEVEVSWQVTGIRQDPWAKAHPVQVEVDKPAKEVGKYLNPELYGKPKEKGLRYNPELEMAVK